MKLKCDLYNLAGQLVDYQLSWKYQRTLLDHLNARKKKGFVVNDSILLVQHPNIYTLGRGATEKNLKFHTYPGSEHQVLRVERGGEVTWHGPGQLVAYPIFDLNKHRRDLHWFTNRLEQTVIDTLLTYSIEGERSDVNTGVWVGKNKISAVGITASRWITMHGIALNVNCDLKNYERIIPCGIAHPDRGVCNMKQQHYHREVSLTKEQQVFGCCNESQQLDVVSRRWVNSFAEVFNLDFVECPDPTATLNKLLQENTDVLHATLVP